jgi:catechol 2,3-dioxygenase-like lactoylglutathione lyase family enzyme
VSRKNMSDMAKLVVELLVSNFTQSLKFYTEVLGFQQLYDRPEEAFAYLDRDGAQIMIAQHDAGDERSWIAGELARPFGRGMNLEIEVEDVEALHATCVRHGARIFLAMEEKWYRRDALLLGVRQFIVLDPDGYLLRLSQSLGTRAVSGEPLDG